MASELVLLVWFPSWQPKTYKTLTFKNICNKTVFTYSKVISKFTKAFTEPSEYGKAETLLFLNVCMIDGYRTLKKDVTSQLLLYSNERKEPGWEQLKVNVVGAEGKKQILSKEQTFLSFFCSSSTFMYFQDLCLCHDYYLLKTLSWIKKS